MARSLAGEDTAEISAGFFKDRADEMDSSALYPTITPVNSFRVVLNLYFGTGLRLLPDINYAYEDFNHPYLLLEITDRIEPP